MKNKIVGYIIITIAAIIGFIIYLFNKAMSKIVATTCTHGLTCTMWDTIEYQTNVSLAIMGFIIIIGLYLIFFGQDEKIITKIKKVHTQIDPKNITKANYKKIIDKLNEDEKKIFEKIIENQGSILQSELVKNIRFGKVKITRILDKLEGKHLIERKRRGMSNIVLLKH